MKPVATLCFIIAVMALLAILMTIFPKDGISVSSDLTLYFPTLKEWWEGGSKDKVGGNAFIPELVEEDQNGAAQSDSVADSKNAEDTLEVADMSGVPTFDSSVYAFQPRPISVESLRQPLDLPASGLGCLKTLFDALTNPDELAKVVRIVHYGDSQIETDRISGYLRYKLQQQFGGSGPGLVPAKTAYDYKAPCEVVCTGDWKRYTIFPFIDTAVHHSKYGALAAFAKFTPIINREPKSTPPASLTPLQQPDSAASSSSDSLPVVVALDSVFKTPDNKPREPEKIYNASLEFRPFKYGYGNAKTIKKVRMFYGNHTRTCNVRVMDGETILYADSLKPNDFYSVKTWNFAQTPEVFKMEFSGADSPEFYGFSMDGLSGVAVDNIALRGCSGTIFTKMNAAHLGGMLRDLNVKCIILQFGGNAVPSLNENNVVAFKNYLASQIRYLKRICPGVSIILIGPADMSVKVQDEYVTYEILPELDRLLKEAALQNDCAYWDMYEAMGGYNTMPDWVFHDPPLAEKDFVHFNPNGANAIAKMFYNALITRYNEYISRQ